MDKSEKDIEFLRGMEKLKSSPVKSPLYSSPLENDVIRVRGGNNLPIETVTKIKNTTEKLGNTNIQKLLSGKEFTDKISRLKAMRKLGSNVAGLGAITALGTGLMSDDASASDIVSNVVEELPGDLPIVGQAYDVIRPEPTGPQQGSFEDRLEKGLLSKEEMELLKQFYSGKR